MHVNTPHTNPTTFNHGLVFICCLEFAHTNTLPFILAYFTCFSGRGNQSTRRKPSLVQGEHANSTQKGPTRGRTQDLLAVKQER